MNTIGTFIFYVLVLLLTVFLVKKADQKEDIRWLIFPVLILAMVAGCRAYEVGTDTLRVVQSIEYTFEKGVFSHSKEYLYYFFCKALMLIWKNPSFVLWFFAFLTNGFVFLRIWDFRKTINSVLTTALYFLFYFGLSMNITRQCLAIAIVFYCTRFIQRRKYKYFYLGVVTAFLIHASSCIAIIFPAMYLIYYGELKITKKDLKKYAAVVLGICVVFGIYLIRRYAVYFSETEVDIGVMNTMCLSVLCMTYFPIFMKYKDVYRYKLKKRKLVESVHLVFAFSVIGNFVAFLGYILPAAGRVGYGFKIFEIIFYGMILENKFYTEKIKIMLCVVLILLGTYSFVTYGGIVPYAFVW